MLYKDLAQRKIDGSFKLPKNYSSKKRKELDRAIPQIKEELTMLRKGLDSFLIEKLKGMAKKDPSVQEKVDNYPWGQCQGISKLIMKAIYKESSPILHKLQKKYKIKKNFGIFENKHFHNALEIGHLYLNVAADTVDLNEEPVKIHTFEDNVYKPITNLYDIATIAEKYWNAEIYANNKHPVLGAYYPIIIVSYGKLHFDQMSVNHFLTDEIKNNFAHTKEFLYHSKYTHKDRSAIKNIIDTRVQSELDKMCEESPKLTEFYKAMLAKSEDIEKAEKKFKRFITKVRPINGNIEKNDTVYYGMTVKIVDPAGDGFNCEKPSQAVHKCSQLSHTS